MSGNFKPVSLSVAALLCVELSIQLSLVTAAPICANSQGGCSLLSLDDLFARVIDHSARLHGMSTDLHADFEHYFLPSKNHIGKMTRNCHTSSILTPTGKENAQRLAREKLAEIVLKLLGAWRAPLWQFQENMAAHHDFNAFSANKALEMSAMVTELRTGVEKVAEKMQHLGMISNSLIGPSFPELWLPSSDSGESRVSSDHELLYCFRRDSNKVQNYLKILQCRIAPEHTC